MAPASSKSCIQLSSSLCQTLLPTRLLVKCFRSDVVTTLHILRVQVIFINRQLLAPHARMHASNAIKSSSLASCLTAILMETSINGLVFLFSLLRLRGISKEAFYSFLKKTNKHAVPYSVSLISFLVTLWGVGSGNDSSSLAIANVPRSTLPSSLRPHTLVA